MKKYLVIGNPIKHTLSPKLHNYWMRSNNIDAVYGKLEAYDNDLKELCNNIKIGELDGINVTVPFKKKIISYLDVLSGHALRTQSVNTICLSNGNVTGHNTDIDGFELSIKKLNYDVSKKKIVILGAGGVGKSVCFALLKLGVKELYIIEKDHIKLEKLIEDLKKQNEQVYSIKLDELIENQHEFDGFLNCSEQGHINTPGNPFDGLKLNSNQWSFDVVYTPAMTTFLKNSENSGAKIITGIDLFLFQGIESFIIFTEQEN